MVISQNRTCQFNIEEKKFLKNKNVNILTLSLPMWINYSKEIIYNIFYDLVKPKNAETKSELVIRLDPFTTTQKTLRKTFVFW